MEGKEVEEPDRWDPVHDLIQYLETLFDSTENVGYVTNSFEKDGKYIVVSKGLGTHTINFRFWNPAELVVLDIIPAFLYNK